MDGLKSKILRAELQKEIAIVQDPEYQERFGNLAERLWQMIQDEHLTRLSAACLGGQIMLMALRGESIDDVTHILQVGYESRPWAKEN